MPSLLGLLKNNDRARSARSFFFKKGSELRHYHIQLFRERMSEKNVHATIPKGNMGYDQNTRTVPDISWHCSCRKYFRCFPLVPKHTYMNSVSCHSFKFRWRTVNSELPTIPFGIVAWTFSDNLSRNSCLYLNSHRAIKCLCVEFLIHLKPPTWKRTLSII